MVYPTWAFFPRQSPAPLWVPSFLESVRACQVAIDSQTHKTLDSDRVLPYDYGWIPGETVPTGADAGSSTGGIDGA